MRAWAARARECVTRGERCSLISVTAAQGSTPREVGARMLITPGAQYGSVGGGKLEFDACAQARALLAGSDVDLAQCEIYRLGPRLGQCCGGTVELCVQTLGPSALPYLQELERLEMSGEPHVSVVTLDSPRPGGAFSVHRMVVRTDSEVGVRSGNPEDAQTATEARRMLRDAETRPCWWPLGGATRAWLQPLPDAGLHLVLFGAGHVGRALVQVLAPLQWRVHWVETRDDAIPRELLSARVSGQVTDVPESLVDEAPPRATFVIMTHDHALDFRLCERALKRSDAVFCGLIGSRSKRARFERRLSARGASHDTLLRLTCPIGLPGLEGKAPGEIAISVAAQLMQVHSRTLAATAPA